jgi:hypothetical protein
MHVSLEAAVRAIVTALLTKIIMRTPIDTGRAAASWMVRAGEPDSFVPPEGTLQTREGAVQAALESVKAVDFGGADIFWIYSNLPYIAVLEYGLYPNPPKKGSYVKGEGYVIKSAEGYSKQAPSGMVRISLAETEVQIEYIIRADLAQGGAR